MLGEATGLRKAVFVVNPNSANASTRKEWPVIERAARSVFPEMSVRFTSRPFEAPELVRQALHDGAELIVSVGGDGTHNEVVNGFFESDRPIREDAALGVLSRGTGGDFRRTLGLGRCFGRDIVATVEQLGKCRLSPCDVGRLTFIDNDGVTSVRYFVNITSFGIGGEVDKRVNESTKMFGGKASFFLGSLRASLAYRNRNVKVAVDGKLFYEGPIYNVAVANGKFFGGGMMIAPDALIDDGMFDVVSCGDFDFWESVQLGRTVYSGKHLGMSKVKVTRGKVIEATSEETVLLDVDGEAPGRLNSKLENVKHALRVLRA